MRTRNKPKETKSGLSTFIYLTSFNWVSLYFLCEWLHNDVLYVVMLLFYFNFGHSGLVILGMMAFASSVPTLLSQIRVFLAAHLLGVTSALLITLA